MEKQKRDVALPETVHPLDLCPMSNRDKSNAMKNIYCARDDLFNHLGGFFWPYDSKFLNGWRTGMGFLMGGAFRQIVLK